MARKLFPNLAVSVVKPLNLVFLFSGAAATIWLSVSLYYPRSIPVKNSVDIKGSSGKKIESKIASPDSIQEIRHPKTLENGEGSLQERLAGIIKKNGLRAALKSAKDERDLLQSVGVDFVLRVGISVDPDFVADEIKRCGLNDLDTDHLIKKLISQWPDLDKAWGWANHSLVGSQRDEAIAVLVAKFAKESPNKALALVQEMNPGRARDNAYIQMILSWGNVDFKSAMNFVNQNVDSRDRALAINGLSHIWAKKDIQSAMKYISDSPEQEKSELLAHLVAIEGVSKDPTATINWSVEITGIAAERATRSALIAWTNLDPEAALKYVESVDEKLQKKVSIPFVSAWTQIDPAAAGDWVRSRHSDLQMDVVVPLLHRWHELSPVDAWKWLDKMPEGPVKQAGAQLLRTRDSVKTQGELIQKFSGWYKDASEDGMLFQAQSTN